MNRWTRHELEQFHDDGLDDDAREALAADLRSTPELQREADEIAALDCEIRDALLHAPTPQQAPARVLPRIAALAACIALAIGGALFLLTRTPPVPTLPTQDMVVVEPPSALPTEPNTRLGSTSGFRLVLSLGPRTAPKTPPDAVAVEAPPTDILAMDDASRRHTYLALGERIRSAASAEATLDTLPAAEQLEACRVWASEPHLRPVAFDRLRRLSVDASLADEVSTVLSELERTPGLDSWLRSYNLAANTTGN
jgi:hypothetical protein